MLKRQTELTLKGMTGQNRMVVYVEEYVTRELLCKLGYRFDPDELSVADVEAFTVINSAIKKHEENEMKKMKRKGRNGGRN